MSGEITQRMIYIRLLGLWQSTMAESVEWRLRMWVIGNLVLSQVKPMTSQSDTRHILAYYSALIGYIKNSLTQFSPWCYWLRYCGIVLVAWVPRGGSTITPLWVHTVSSWYPSLHDLRCCKDIKRQEPRRCLIYWITYRSEWHQITSHQRACTSCLCSSTRCPTSPHTHLPLYSRLYSTHQCSWCSVQ